MKRLYVGAAAALLSVALLAGCTGQVSVNLDDCAFSAPRAGSVSAVGVKSIRIRAEAGRMEVRGQAGAAEVKADGKACAASAGGLDGLRLTVDRVGDEVRIVAEGPSMNMGLSPHLDFVVSLPADVPLIVDKGSGTASIYNVAALDLDKGSGTTDVDGVAGDIRLAAMSGTMTVRNVKGSLQLRQGSGTARLESVSGDVVVTDKASGTLTIAQVGRSVQIDNMGSGIMDVRDVQGDVTVNQKSSGSLTISEVGRNVMIGSMGSGLLSVRTVKGDLSVRQKSSGSISYDNIGGRVNVPSR